MRACDVYVGVDVWGRGTNSGGGYNTITDVALIAHQGLSCALFAPGWIFEHEFDCEFSAAYEQKEREFWNSTVTSATEDGQLLLSKSSTCIANYSGKRSNGFLFPLFSNFARMFGSMEFVRGVPWNFAAYSPRFCSMLPLLDETADGGSELEGKWAGNDGYQGNGCLEIRGYLGGKKKRQAITLFRLDDAMTMEPLVVSVVMKKEAEKWVRTDGLMRRTEWNLLLDFALEDVENLKTEESDAAEEGNETKEEKEPEMIIHRRLVEKTTSAGAEVISPFLHTRCGGDWERWWWMIPPILARSTVLCLRSIQFECRSDSYEESRFKLGWLYCAPLNLHAAVYHVDYLPRNVTFSVLANPPQRNKQEALQCSYGILRWQAAVKEVNTGEAMVPVVDFWRVFVDGKYWGKTRSLSFCLKKKVGAKPRKYAILIQPVTIYGSSVPLKKCEVISIRF